MPSTIIDQIFSIAEDIGLVVKDLPKGVRKVDELDLTFVTTCKMAHQHL